MSAASDLEIAVEDICREINQNARSRATRGLNIIRNVTLVVLGQNGSGRVYRRGKKGVHIASAPNEPPAPDSSDLRKNWTRTQFVKPNGMGKYGLRITLKSESDMPYQKFLQFGTRRMAPREHINRIKKRATPQIAALFANI